jgi:hypothetical protein
MGLLDDAIREHLELKRLRGADPGEVAREQREALDPISRHGDAEMEGDVIAPEEPASEGLAGAPPADASLDAAGGMALLDGATAGDDPPGELQPAPGPGFSNVGQETVELDMRTVLEEEGQAAAPMPTSGAAGEHPAEDSLEWEVPIGPSSSEVPAVDMGDDEEPVAEDVLEETPDFLRDTPEQERLWFEQQPPRDFDFDK